MKRPLYRSLATGPVERKDGNAGLFYDKFCDQWNDGQWTLGGGDDPGKKLAWIKTVVGMAGKTSLISEYIRRRVFLAQSLGVEPVCYKTSGPFVTGLGESHPVENGFSWHPTLGTPYLPGASVKGLVRSWAAEWQETPDPEKILRIFGSDHKDPQKAKHGMQVGSVVFHDALPVKSTLLKAEVMTPHYGKYYENGEIPGDWLSPVPIPFLAVDKDQVFQFLVTPRRFGSAKDMADAETATGWLHDALTLLGAGAKTAVGYGLFRRDETAESREILWAEAGLSWDRASQSLKAACGGKSAVVDLSNPQAREDLLKPLPEESRQALMKKPKKRKKQAVIARDILVEPVGPNFRIIKLL